MRASEPAEPSAATIVAARDGDRDALGELISEYLPLLYNIVGRALNGHADVDDVVQETVLRVLHGIATLRDPAAFRSWLVAVAIHQVRDHHRSRRRSQARQAPLDEVVGIADPESDFAGLTTLRLGLSGQRKEIAEATRWLDPDERELLALWWLEEGGYLRRGDLVAALGLSAAHVAVRVRRMKERLDTSRTVVRALRSPVPCPGLTAQRAEWDGVPSPLWRKRLARHVRDCAGCSGRTEALISADRLLAELALVPVPVALAGLTSQLVRTAPAEAAAAQHTAAQHTASATHRAAHAKASGIGVKALVAVPLAAGAVTGMAGLALLGHDRAAPAVRAESRPPAATVTSAPPTPHLRVRGYPPAPVRPAKACKKGVSTWTFAAADRALAASRACWFYDWAAGPSGISRPAGVDFVPMIWGARSADPATLATARSQGRNLLAFNEPDMGSQANMPVDEALTLWPKLAATKLRLGSPAVATGGATPGGWLDRFMRGAAKRGYRVDFIALHWYGSDFRPGNAVAQLRGYLQAVHDRYHKPIWLTEYALIRFGASATYPSQQAQAEFVRRSAAMLRSLPYAERYAWFALPATSGSGTGLFTTAGRPTTVGKAFQTS
jgi:RNA polymerase sigma factor (sigma-70 family)